MSMNDSSPPPRALWDAVAWQTPGPMRDFAVAAGIFVVAFLGYYLSATQLLSTEPLDWYKHFVFMADAINHGTLDLASTGIPDYYQDLVREETGEVYLPYQPAPAVLLMPVVAVWGTGTHEWLISMIVGAFNVVLFWLVLRSMGVGRTNKLLLLPFFAFGTANFYSATTGTLWYYNHVVAVMFLMLAVLLLVRRAHPALIALALGGAFLSRQATILAAPAFLYWFARQRQDRVFTTDILHNRAFLSDAGWFCATLLPVGLFTFWYNAVRFGGILDTGLGELYDYYAGIAYTPYLAVPGAERFAEFDLRNIPLHIYTMFLLPPEFATDGSLLHPSKFGMSILLTSPPLIFAALVRKADPLKTVSWIAIPLVALPALLYYNMGWVQFGYRFLMDYMPFLMVLTALGFEGFNSSTSLRWKVVLVLSSVAVGFWGRYWGTELGW